MGGTDVNPARYGDAIHPMTQSPDDDRDAFEFEILGGALEAGMPVLAICRGLQLLNVYAGGTLHQHLASPRHNPPDDAESPHDVEIEPGTVLSSISAQNRCRVNVNSYHHQAAAQVGPALRI